MRIGSTSIRLSLVVLGLQTAGIGAAVYCGYLLTREFNIIPRAIFPFPDFYVSRAGLLKTLNVFCISHFVTFLLLQIRHGPDDFTDARRFAVDYLGMLCAYTVSSLYLFVATDISYDPQMMAAIGILSTVFLFGAFSVRAALGAGARGVFTGLARSTTAVVKAICTLQGAAIILFFLSPLLLAKAFYTDQDFANLITQTRIRFSEKSAGTWALTNALGSMVFSQPMLAKMAPHDPQQLYVLERAGRLLRVLYPGGDVQDVVLDITGKVGEVEVENGALGFAFHPQFGAANSRGTHLVYLYYTAVRDGHQTNKVSQFDLSAGTPDQVADSEIELMALDRDPSGWHNGGSIEFGPDGYLYIAFGEGVHTAEHKSPAEVLRAGIVRVDVGAAHAGASHEIVRHAANGTTGNYRIPEDNPFNGIPGILEEYWAVGLRNSFRFSFDPDSQVLWAGDVGSTVWEEVNVIKKGGNYQFPFVEGRKPTRFVKPQQIFGVEQGPVYTYEHTAYDRAVIGGIVYRGTLFDELRGKYIFADNYSAKIFAMPATGDQTDDVEVLTRANQFAQRGVSSVTQIMSGDVLVTVLGAASNPSGEVLKLAYANAGTASSVTHGPVGAQPAAAPGPVPPYTNDRAGSLFAVNCARCHGLNGLGDGPDAAALDTPLPDFSSNSFHSSRTDEQLRGVVRDGGAAHGLSPMMPPWGELLQPYEVEFLIRYVRELRVE